jgi:hypothetical protein
MAAETAGPSCLAGDLLVREQSDEILAKAMFIGRLGTRPMWPSGRILQVVGTAAPTQVA